MFFQDITPVSNPKRFIGEYYTDEAITLHEKPVWISTHKVKNNTHQYLILVLAGLEFPLSYVGDNIFKIIHTNSCKNFVLGIHGERLYFEKPKSPQGKVEQFVIYGIHLRGKVRFRRAPKSK